MNTQVLVAKLARLWHRAGSGDITEEDPTFSVVYLGNTVTQWAKGDGSVDKPLATLWRNYCQSTKPDIRMQVTVCVSGLKARTQQHGLTEYWSNRLTFAFAHPSYPKVFCWIYRHEGRRMKQELRCHAVLCRSEAKAHHMQRCLRARLHQALVEFRKEKQMRQNARLSPLAVLYSTSSGGAAGRHCLLNNHWKSSYRPPLERSKSAPRLCSIAEDSEGERRAALAEQRLCQAAADGSTDGIRSRAYSEPTHSTTDCISSPVSSARSSGARTAVSSQTAASCQAGAEESCLSDTAAASSTPPASVDCCDTNSHQSRLSDPLVTDSEEEEHDLPSPSSPGAEASHSVAALLASTLHDDLEDSASDESGYSDERYAVPASLHDVTAR